MRGGRPGPRSTAGGDRPAGQRPGLLHLLDDADGRWRLETGWRPAATFSLSPGRPPVSFVGAWVGIPRPPTEARPMSAAVPPPASPPAPVPGPPRLLDRVRRPHPLGSHSRRTEDADIHLVPHPLRPRACAGLMVAAVPAAESVLWSRMGSPRETPPTRTP